MTDFENKAIGLIETTGLLGAIATADIMKKSSFVETSVVRIDGIYFTVVAYGDYDAVKIAIEKGLEAGEKICKILAYVIIGRPSQEIIDFYIK